MGMSVRRGRVFTESDGPERAGVVVLNQAFVDRFLGGRDALGRQIAIEDGQPRVREVVGAVADAKHFSAPPRVLDGVGRTAGDQLDGEGPPSRQIRRTTGHVPPHRYCVPSARATSSWG
jgi:hypothetical protein